MKTSMLLPFLFCIATEVFGGELTEILPVSTYINKALLYPYRLSITPEPAYLYLTYNPDEKKFDDESSTLWVRSDIPSNESGLGFTYNLSLIENVSKCFSMRYDNQGDVLEENIINLEMDGETFDENNPSKNNQFDDVENGFLYGKNQLTLKSQTFENIIMDCSGSIVIEAELAL